MESEPEDEPGESHLSCSAYPSTDFAIEGKASSPPPSEPPASSQPLATVTSKTKSKGKSTLPKTAPKVTEPKKPGRKGKIVVTEDVDMAAETSEAALSDTDPELEEDPDEGEEEIDSDDGEEASQT